MKKGLRFVCGIILAFCLSLCTFSLPVRADAGVTISLTASKLSIGQKVTATINVTGSEVSAYTIYVNYTSALLQYESSSGSAQCGGGSGTLTLSGTGAGSTSIVFTAIANGSASVATGGSEVYDINLDPVAISHASVLISVETEMQPTTTEVDTEQTTQESTEKTTEQSTEQTTENPEERSSNCNLSSLEISPGTLSPEFSKSVTSYYVQVDEDVTAVYVSAQTEDPKAQTTVTGAGLIEPGDNTVNVTVTAENGAVRVYHLRVVAGEDQGMATAEIGGKEYTFSNHQGDLDIPEGFQRTAVPYGSWMVTAFAAPDGGVLCCPMLDENEEMTWFYYDPDKELLLPYTELSAEYNRYVVLPAPEAELPEGFSDTEIMINNQKFQAFQNESLEDRDIYLIYAKRIGGDAGFYYFDAKEMSFQRYAVPAVVEKEVYLTPTDAESTEAVKPEPETKIVQVVDKNSVKKDVLTRVIIFFGLFSAALLLTVILLFIRLRRIRGELQNADDMVRSLAKNKSYVGQAKTSPDVDALVAEVLGTVDAAGGKGDAAEGKGDAVKGKADAAEGKADAAEGMAKPPQGKADAAEGKVKPVQGKADAVEDKVKPVQGKADAVEENIKPAEGKADAVEENIKPAEGKADAVEDKVNSADNKVDTAESESDIEKGRDDSVEGSPNVEKGKTDVADGKAQSGELPIADWKTDPTKEKSIADMVDKIGLK